jgi:GT2 family glycosyltransferase
MKIAVVTIAYSSRDGVAHLVESSCSVVHELEFHLFLHSRHDDAVNVCSELAQDPRIIYYPYGCNRGVSKSWNEGMLSAYTRGADVVIIANDDIEFSRGDVDKIAEKALKSRECYLLSSAGFHARFNCRIPSFGYSCFAINPIALEKIGCFDENIFPAYCEDQDYCHRAMLAGLSEANCSNTMLFHGGSSAIMSNPALARQNCLTQGRNHAYYRRKWGGDSGSEAFSHPFNNPCLDYHIDLDRRHNPYGPAYDRCDHDIVKL